VSDTTHGMPLVRRIFDEHRRVVLPLAIALVVNIIAYAFAVYPLSQRVANIEERDRAAEMELAAAQQEHADASGTVVGKDRAAKELETFYTQILPADVAGARRLISLRLQQLARQSNLQWESLALDSADDRDETLRALRGRMTLAGSYASMRSFLHQLETAQEFVVIDNVELADGADDDGSLTVNIQVSTYFRTAAP
jgi:Tfp pilus assembly protein PilO